MHSARGIPRRRAALTSPVPRRGLHGFAPMRVRTGLEVPWPERDLAEVRRFVVPSAGAVAGPGTSRRCTTRWRAENLRTRCMKAAARTVRFDCDGDAWPHRRGQALFHRLHHRGCVFSAGRESRSSRFPARAPAGVAPERPDDRGRASGSSSRWHSIGARFARRQSGFARVARWLGSVVCYVHVVPDRQVRLGGRGRGPGHPIGFGSRTPSRCLAALGVGVLRDAAVQTRVLVGDTTREIAKVAATERAGLVITTRRTPRDWFGPRRGSISYDVLSHVATPVLALPG